MHISAAMTQVAAMLLEVDGLDVSYGAVRAVRGVSIALGEGEIVAVLGANGAGKTSLLRAIQGLVPPAAGSVRWNGNVIDPWSTPERVRHGMVLVPEGRQIFITLTVHENLLAGAYTRHDVAILRDIDAIYDRFPNLSARRHMAAAVLSGGEQQMLAIGRALLSRPKLMMLDEPSLGLSPLLSTQIFALMAALNREGLSILLVEQNTRQALGVAHRGIVLELGRVVMAGTPQELLSDDRLRKAYLGE
jgi:branched-chain amino acid transport system ATP-binding protein